MRKNKQENLDGISMVGHFSSLSAATDFCAPLSSPPLKDSPLRRVNIVWYSTLSYIEYTVWYSTSDHPRGACKTA